MYVFSPLLDVVFKLFDFIPVASVIAGALACWNQPIEVIRVEMQSWANKVPDESNKEKNETSSSQ